MKPEGMFENIALSDRSRYTIAAVVIGRNEGERLRVCLAALSGRVQRIVYVDSGSTDASVAVARSFGVEIVELDNSKKFTAARGRNVGFTHLTTTGEQYPLVQFVDGDSAFEPDWFRQAASAIAANPQIGIVTGWAAELHRDTSIYGAMLDVEWRGPTGEITACGGNMLVRREAFAAVGGFNDQVIAGEDDDLCIRTRKAGWQIHRLPIEMAKHDGGMTKFGQWWKRSVRNGHAFAELGQLHPGHLVADRLRVFIFGLALPIVAIVGSFWSNYAIPAVIALYAISYIRTAFGLQKNGLAWPEAASLAGLLSLSKFPNLIGAATYYRNRHEGKLRKLIEYK